jgi:FtsZ-binding cell division protein ZapB
MESTIVVALIGILGSIFTYLFTKPQQKADVSGAISAAANTSVETLLKVMEELRSGMDEIRSTNELLKCEIDKLVEENVLLQGEIHELKMQNEKLLAENVKLRKEIHKLTSELSK